MIGEFGLTLLLGAALGACSANAIACEKSQQTLERLRSEGFAISEPLEFEDVERQNTIPLNKDGQVQPVAFGYANAKWQELKAKAKPGDRLVYASFKRSETRYILIHDNCVIDTLLIFRS